MSDWEGTTITVGCWLSGLALFGIACFGIYAAANAVINAAQSPTIEIRADQWQCTATSRQATIIGKGIYHTTRCEAYSRSK